MIYEDLVAPASFSRSLFYACATVLTSGIYQEINTWKAEMLLERSRIVLAASQIVFGILFGYNLGQHIIRHDSYL